MIIGSAQSGKTNLLQTIIRSLASYYTPQEVNIYVIVFASMVLRNFEDLHHVGGVVTPAEDEKLKKPDEAAAWRDRNEKGKANVHRRQLLHGLSRSGQDGSVSSPRARQWSNSALYSP